MAQVTIKGYAEFQQKTLRLGKAEWLRDAIEPGAREIGVSVRGLAPGSIKNLVVARMAKNPKVAAAYVAIDMKLSRKPLNSRGRRVRYPYFVEYGVPRHAIKAVNSKGLPIGGGKFAETVNHPGFAGVKYFARGIRAGRNRAARLIEQNLVAIMAGLEGGRGLAA